MNDRQIEEMLCESLSPSDETLVRVERRARQEFFHKQAVRWITYWKPILVTAAILVVILGNISDHSCQAEMAAMTNGADSKITTPICADSLFTQRRQMEELLTQLPTSEKDLRGVI